MKRFIYIMVLILLMSPFTACTGKTDKANTKPSITESKNMVLSFLNAATQTASLPQSIITITKRAEEYTLTVNRSGNIIYFHLSIKTPGDITSSDIENTGVNLSISGNTLVAEGFSNMSFEDAAVSTFIGQDSWILHLIYDKAVMFSVGTNLPHGAKLFVVSTNESSPWDTYVSLSNLNITDKDPIQEGNKYILTLKDGHTVNLIQTDTGVDIYK